MPSNSNILPTVASGWTNSNNVLLDDGTNATDATASKTWDGFAWVYANGASLLASVFTGIDTGVLAGDRITGITVEVQFGYTSVACDQVFVYLCNGGAVLAGSSYKTFTPSGAGIATFTLGGSTDLWGLTSMTKAQLTALQVMVIATKTVAAGTADTICDVIKVTSTYAEVRPTFTPATFTDVTGVNPSYYQTSNNCTIGGLGSETTSVVISTDGYFAVSAFVNGALWGVSSGSITISPIADGDVIAVYVPSNPTYLSTANITVSAASNYVSDVYSVTTRAEITTVNAFTFSDYTNCPPGLWYNSGIIYPSGFDSTYHPSMTKVGTGLIDVYRGGVWYYDVATPYSVNYGDAINVRESSSATPGTTKTTTVTIGGTSDGFSVTTQSDPYCDDFWFTWETGASPSTDYYSNVVTISGMLTAGVYVYAFGYNVTASYISKNGGAWTALPYTGSCSQGDTFQFKVTTAAGTPYAGGATLQVGFTNGTVATYFVETGVADVHGNAFAMTDVNNARPGAMQTSNIITMAGITGGYSTASFWTMQGIPIEYSYNGGAWVSAYSNGPWMFNGDTIQFRCPASRISNGRININVSLGGYTDVWTITTRGSPPPQDF